MSKGNMLQGMARGKVGDLVFYVRNGAQQTRVRNRQPENPRSKSQMNQRVKLASVVGFYKRQASFFRFALKKSQKESYYNAFVRYNINLSPYLTKEQAANGVTVPAPYVIADGEMPRVAVGSSVVSEDGVLTLRTDIMSTMNTWGDMRRRMDLQIGDMLSIVVFNASDDELNPAQRIVSQHVFDTESENMPIGYDMVGTSWAVDDGWWTVAIDPTYFGVVEFYATGSAIVLSRNNGQVDCSYAQLHLNIQARLEYSAKRTAEAQAQAAASYGVESVAILDPKQFEGNYVDMTSFYSTSDFTTPITQLTFSEVESQTVYVKASDVVGVTSARGRLIAGSDVLSEVTFYNNTKAVNITPKNTPGSGTFVFEFLDSAGIVVKSAVLTLTLEDY